MRGPGRCAVIGAGVLGVCVAARLAEAGVAVTLLEQARPGHAATRSSFAWLNANDKAPRAYHDLNHAGMRWCAARGDGFRTWPHWPARRPPCRSCRGRRPARRRRAWWSRPGR
jgi:glycine/D-amino acid oxidase-like deaminating enzyme